MTNGPQNICFRAVKSPGAFVEEVEGKDKVFPYSLPSVGTGADPGVQAVSLQVT